MLSVRLRQLAPVLQNTQNIMQYLGSKNKIAHKLLDIMKPYRKTEQVWVEPFVGGGNMIDKVSGRRIGNDSHKYLVALLKAVSSGWNPPEEVSKDFYYHVKSHQELYTDELIGFIGFLCSFGGKWWGGYAANSKGDNYAARGARSLARQRNGLTGVEWSNSDYRMMEIPPRSLIYCDPPYRGTTGYSTRFDHDVFYRWCSTMTEIGHTVFVSEYWMPEGFQLKHTINHKTILNKNQQIFRAENLYLCVV